MNLAMLMGAGASQEAGVPTLDDIPDRSRVLADQPLRSGIHQTLTKPQAERFQRFLSFDRDRRVAEDASAKQKLDVELALRRAFDARSVGAFLRDEAADVSPDADDIDVLRHLLQDHLDRVVTLSGTRGREHVDVVERHLRLELARVGDGGRLTICSMNYDAILDVALGRVLGLLRDTTFGGFANGLAWSDGAAALQAGRWIHYENRAVRLLKPHGSILWLYCPNPRCHDVDAIQRAGMLPLEFVHLDRPVWLTGIRLAESELASQPGAYYERLHQTAARDLFRQTTDRRASAAYGCPCCLGAMHTVLEPPLPEKAGRGLAALLWDEFARDVIRADELELVGCRLPDSDANVRQLLRDAVGRSESLRAIRAVSRKSASGVLESVFGEVASGASRIPENGGYTAFVERGHDASPSGDRA